MVAGEEVAAVERPVRGVEQGLGGGDVEERGDGEAPGVPQREVPQRRERVERRRRHVHLQYQEVVPVPLPVDLAEVDAVADDAAAAGGEEHVAERAPELVGQGPDAEEDEQQQQPVVGARPLPRPPRHRLPHQRRVQHILVRAEVIPWPRRQECGTHDRKPLELDLLLRPLSSAQ